MMHHVRKVLARDWPHLKPLASTYFHMVNRKAIIDRAERKKYYQVWDALNCDRNEDDIDYMWFLWHAERTLGKRRQEDEDERLYLKSIFIPNEDLVKLGHWEGHETFQRSLG